MGNLSVVGLAARIGLYVYIFSIIMTYQVSLVIFGRPSFWLIVLLTPLLAFFWWENHATLKKQEHLGLTLLFLGGILLYLGHSIDSYFQFNSYGLVSQVNYFIL